MDFDVIGGSLSLDAGAETPSLLSSTRLVQIGIFLLSLLDDAAILGLSRLGIHIPGLNLLGTIAVLAIVAHWLGKLGHYLIEREQRRFFLS
jgi:hypothetical protein